MMLRIRVVLADKPGSLAAVTAAIAVAAADVVAFDVLGSDGIEAVDDITVRVTDKQAGDRLVARLGDVPGVVVESSRVTHALPGHRQDLQAIRLIVADPASALNIFTAQLPLVVQADWALVAAIGRADPQIVAMSVGAPADLDVDLPNAGLLGARAVRGRTRPSYGALAPMGSDKVVLVVRESGPQFRRQELVHLQRLAETVVMMTPAS